MATIIGKKKQVQVADGSTLQPPAEELGVPFGCYDGKCGVCRIEVLEGMENLSEINQREKDLGCEGNQRQACQCTVKEGIIKIDF
jgi:ferredoxin